MKPAGADKFVFLWWGVTRAGIYWTGNIKALDHSQPVLTPFQSMIYQIWLSLNCAVLMLFLCLGFEKVNLKFIDMFHKVVMRQANVSFVQCDSKSYIPVFQKWKKLSQDLEQIQRATSSDAFSLSGCFNAWNSFGTMIGCLFVHAHFVDLYMTMYWHGMRDRKWKIHDDQKRAESKAAGCAISLRAIHQQTKILNLWSWCLSEGMKNLRSCENAVIWRSEREYDRMQQSMCFLLCIV